MKIFVEDFLQNIAIQRISSALNKYPPLGHEIVMNKEDADFVVVIAYGQRRYMEEYTRELLKQNKKYSIIQLSLRGTSNPNTNDWIPIWEKAESVWSYYNLPALCKEDGIPIKFNFYHAPLGVDADVFKETSLPRKFIIANTGSGKAWNKECKNEGILAANGKPVFQMGVGENSDTITFSNLVDDYELAKYYSQCQFVSGLRRIEGFELPVIEGLLCGARPIVFDRPHYRDWFDGLAEFIPEDYPKITDELREVFKKGARPVTDSEKEYVKTHFNWEDLCDKFWQKTI
jgi:hypothetical protein